MNEMMNWLLELPQQVIGATAGAHAPFILDCKGDNEVEQHRLDPFYSVMVDAPVIYRHSFDGSMGNQAEIEIHGSDKSIRNLAVEVNNGCLSIRTRCAMMLYNPIIIHTKGPAIKKVTAMNHSRVKISEIFSLMFEAVCYDNADLELSGTTSRLNRQVNGRSIINTDHLRVIHP